MGVEELPHWLVGRKPEDLMGAGGFLGDLKERLCERAIEGELTAHLGYENDALEGRNRPNSRDGRSMNRLKTDSGELELEIRGAGHAALIRRRRRRARLGSRVSQGG